jgi:hypothetical protein
MKGVDRTARDAQRMASERLKAEFMCLRNAHVMLEEAMCASPIKT